MISARGVPYSWDGSGETDGSGVGKGGGSSGAVKFCPFFTGALFLFRGEALLLGDSG